MNMILQLIFILTIIQAKVLPEINSIIDRTPEEFETSIEGYKKNEFWGIWSMPISKKIIASSSLKGGPGVSYKIENIQDYDLNTAWVPKAESATAKEYFQFTFAFPDNHTYASAYQFQGICNVFNGYCKSLALWKANSRIKKLLVYYNNHPVCYVNLKDTWHFQTFDISRFFINRRAKTNLKAKYEIKNDDKLKFEIVEIYRGTKYNDVAVSEFLCDGAKN